MEKTYRVGLVGCGWVSGEHIRAYQQNPQTEIVALASRSIDEAQVKAEESDLSVSCFDSIESMMKNQKPDIVSITSPPQFHVEHALCAIENGAQIVLEKPIALEPAGLAQLVQSVKANNTKSIVSFVLRWNPLYSIIRNLIDDGSLGDLYYGEVDYYHGIGPWYKQFSWNVTKEAGGNSLLSAGCHAVDGLVWFLGGRVTEVHAYSTRSSAEEYQPYEYDPTIVTLCKMDNGKIGKVTCSIECKSPYMYPIRLFGSKGTIRDNQIYSDKLSGQTQFATIPTILPDSGDVTHHPFQGEIDHFVDCLNQGHDSSVPIEYAAHIMKICFAAEESAKTGQPVSIQS
jgi:UDP-N-acetyl-2-amino-2-deoxyglucuronate dehydrogenase